MFETKTNVKLHDTDAAGVVFFANYFRIAHTAFEALMTSIGVSLDYIIREADYLILIAHADADYDRPLLLGEKITISMKTESIGESSFVLIYDFRDSAGKIAAKVRTVHVAVDKNRAEKIPLPEKVRIGLESLK
ncbi:MAG TPA: acyl-CoA thioesterase [candidate division Zixibacteria bacterium]|nr:acyl-CoA thioesterase [candidate division Zixibacteria bacterium]